jgi:hypothetical protein
MSLTILDNNLREIPIETHADQPIELRIPRDSTMIVPAMILQNVTSSNFTFHQQFFHFHYVNLTNDLPLSVHLDIAPLNALVSYLLISRHDGIPQWPDLIHGWTCFSPSSNSSFWNSS